MRPLNTMVVSIGMLATFYLTVVAADELATLRNGTSITEEIAPAPIPKVVDSDIRTLRNYPMQPPMIPHDTRGYEINLQVNKCMSCHARTRIEESQAPMISVTHFMDRDGNFLAEISPRRYFCNQCHINQTQTRPLLGNTFKDMDKLLEERSAQKQED